MQAKTGLARGPGCAPRTFLMKSAGHPGCGWPLTERRIVTKEEVISAMKECAVSLGHAPSFPELRKLTQVILWDIRKNFGTYGRALQACDLKRHGGGYKLEMRTLFREWAEATRSLAKVPTMFEYEEQGGSSCRALMRRCGGWSNVPIRMLEYAAAGRLAGRICRRVGHCCDPPAVPCGTRQTYQTANQHANQT